jgi:hypothetical protein
MEFVKKGQTWEEYFKTIEIISTRRTAYRDLNVSLMADLYVDLEKSNKRVEIIGVNPLTYSIIRKWGKDFIDVETHKEILMQGIMSYMWGADIRINSEISPNIVLALSEDEGKKFGAILELGSDIPNSEVNN